jgi:hypothetical protein
LLQRKTIAAIKASFMRAPPWRRDGAHALQASLATVTSGQGIGARRRPVPLSGSIPFETRGGGRRANAVALRPRRRDLFEHEPRPSTATPPALLVVHVFPGPDRRATGRLYEDEGEGHEHARGVYRDTRFTAVVTDAVVVVEEHARLRRAV